MIAVDLAAVQADDRTIEALRAGETPSDERLVRLLAAMRTWVRSTEDEAEQEIWRPIPRHPGYEASSLGRVRSVPRTVVCRDGRTQRWPGRLRQPRIEPSKGRHFVDLPENGRLAGRLVGQLVLEAFVGPRPTGLVCCHNDDVQSNNALANLRWDTPSENQRDIVRNGNHYLRNRTCCPRGHVLAVPNLRADEWKRGHRSCLACNRAQSYVRHWTNKGATGLDAVGISHAYYAQITREGES